MHKNYHKGLGIGISFQRKDINGTWGFAQSTEDLDYWLKYKAIDNLDYIEGLQLLKEVGFIK